MKKIIMFALLMGVNLQASTHLMVLDNKHLESIKIKEVENNTPEIPKESEKLSTYIEALTINSVQDETILTNMLNHVYKTSSGSGYLAYHNGGFVFEYDNPKVMTKYIMQAYGDVSRYDTNVNSWKLEGSNNSNDWELVDSKSGQNNWYDREVREFDISNTKAYKYYRVIFLGNGTYSSGIGFSDFETYGYE